MTGPGGYGAKSSWLAAVAELAPGASAAAERRRESLRAWAETSWSNKLDPRDAPTFSGLRAAFMRAYRGGGRWPDPLAALRHELALVEHASERIARLPNRAIATQAADFLANGRASARSGELAGRLLAAERPALGVRATSEGFAGHAAPPDPGRAGTLRLRTAAAAAAARADSEFTYGWRTPIAFEIPPYAVPRNVLDAFVDRALLLDLAWLPRSLAASSSARLTLDGAPVALDEDGRFRLPAGACGGLLVATDGASGRTAVRVPACP